MEAKVITHLYLVTGIKFIYDHSLWPNLDFPNYWLCYCYDLLHHLKQPKPQPETKRASHLEMWDIVSKKFFIYNFEFCKVHSI